jgi:hypothetical protein
VRARQPLRAIAVTGPDRLEQLSYSATSDSCQSGCGEALYWTIGVVVVALAWFLVLMISRRRNLDNAAMHAAEHRGVAPLDETLDYGPAS